MLDSVMEHVQHTLQGRPIPEDLLSEVPCLVYGYGICGSTGSLGQREGLPICGADRQDRIQEFCHSSRRVEGRVNLQRGRQTWWRHDCPRGNRRFLRLTACDPRVGPPRSESGLGGQGRVGEMSRCVIGSLLALGTTGVPGVPNRAWEDGSGFGFGACGSS